MRSGFGPGESSASRGCRNCWRPSRTGRCVRKPVRLDMYWPNRRRDFAWRNLGPCDPKNSCNWRDERVSAEIFGKFRKAGKMEISFADKRLASLGAAQGKGDQVPMGQAES